MPNQALNGGAWQLDTDNNTWIWVPGGTPQSTQIPKWGTNALTNVTQDPYGNPNHGAWSPVHGGGWQWTWGINPDSNTARHYPPGALTDPNHIPGNGLPGNYNTNNAQNPATPNDPGAPTLTNVWGNTGPDVTGDIPPKTPGQGPPQTPLLAPPIRPPFVVAPGSVRDVENAVLVQASNAITSYNTLKGKVDTSRSQFTYMGNDRTQMLADQDQALLSIGDAIEIVGQYAGLLNAAAQVYAHADQQSFLAQQ